MIALPAQRRRLAGLAATLLATVTLAMATVTFAIAPLLHRFSGAMEDFGVYSAAAGAVARGVNPYQSFSAAEITMGGYDYPPFTVGLLFRPLALLAPADQATAWLWMSLAALVVGAVVVADAVLPATWPRRRLGVAGVLLFAPATYNLWHGQLNTFIFLLLALALREWMLGRQVRCGVLLGLAAGIKLAPIILVICLLRRHWWRASAALAGTTLATALAGVLALGWPATLTWVRVVLPVLARDNGWIYNQTWNGVVNRVAGNAVLAPASGSALLHLIALALSAVTVVVAAAAVRPVRRHAAERAAEFGAVVAAMLLAGSVAWYPVYIHLLIALAGALALWSLRPRAHRALLSAAVVTAAVLAVLAPAALALMTMRGVTDAVRGPLGWLFLQLNSLPALTAGLLLLATVGALRRGDVLERRTEVPPGVGVQPARGLAA